MDTNTLIIATMAGLTVTFLLLGIFVGRSPKQSLLDRRVRQFSDVEEVDPLTISFGHRVLQPLFSRVMAVVGRVLPSQLLAALETRLERAGRPMTSTRFLAIWIGFSFVVPLLFATLFALTSGLQLAHIGGLLFWAGLGSYLTWSTLRRTAAARSKRIAKDLPDAIDLIVTNVEAGLGLQAAIVTVSEKFTGPLSEELARVIREISVGAGRTEALVAMAERTGVAELRLFTRAIGQAEQTGIPIARVLRNHAVELREKRRQAAREHAAKIPIKITFPTVMVMFPTLFLLILGPVILNVMSKME